MCIATDSRRSAGVERSASLYGRRLSGQIFMPLAIKLDGVPEHRLKPNLTAIRMIAERICALQSLGQIALSVVGQQPIQNDISDVLQRGDLGHLR